MTKEKNKGGRPEKPKEEHTQRINFSFSPEMIERLRREIPSSKRSKFVQNACALCFAVLDGRVNLETVDPEFDIGSIFENKSSG